MPGFVFKNVFYKWHGGKQILENASFEIPEGTFTILKGSSGSGKTTLLRLMTLLEIQQDGEIFYDGKILNTYSPVLLRKIVGFLPQVPVVTGKSVGDALLQPFSFAANRLLPLPDETELYGLINALFDEPLALDTDALSLSVGQKQRLCFIRLLLLSPQTLLLDEPTASLDYENKKKMIKLIRRQHQDGKTIIVVTHDPLLFDFHGQSEACLENNQITMQ